jgi:hypothetical protein
MQVATNVFVGRIVGNPEVTIQLPLAATIEIEGAKSQELAQKSEF